MIGLGQKFGRHKLYQPGRGYSPPASARRSGRALRNLW